MIPTKTKPLRKSFAVFTYFLGKVLLNLVIVELLIQLAVFHQFLVRAVGDEFAFIEHQDTIDETDATEAVSDDQGGHSIKQIGKVPSGFSPRSHYPAPRLLHP